MAPTDPSRPGVSPLTPDIIWYAAIADEGSASLTAFTSADFRDGTVVGAEDLADVDLAAVPSLWHARYEPATGRLLSVQVPGNANRMWYVEVGEPDGAPPAVNLVAYETRHFPADMVVDAAIFRPLAIRSEEQLGAIRWWPGTGQIHQVYVQPLRRRQGIATALLYAAAAHLMVSGSPRGLWASGDRTQLGEALAHGLPHPQRVRVHRRLAAPMTPAQDAAGVPERNLFPSP
jgi:GNAT superfamily N-acetyltransferase